MTLILINEQGASEQYRNVESIDAAVRIVETWQDPENLNARLSDEGEIVYEGPATDLGK